MGVTALRGTYGEGAVLLGAFAETLGAGTVLKMALTDSMGGNTHQYIIDNVWKYQEIVDAGWEIVSAGYVAGGIVFPRNAVDVFVTPATIDSVGVGWTGLTATVKYAVLYCETDIDGFDSKLVIATYDLEDTGGVLNLVADVLNLTFPSNEFVSQAMV